jgi:hypothetical protein
MNIDTETAVAAAAQKTPFAVPGAHSGLANPAGVSFRCAVGNGLGAPGSNTGGIRAHIDELVIVKGWAGDISGITSEIVL